MAPPFPPDVDAALAWLAEEFCERPPPARRGQKKKELTLRTLVDEDGVRMFKMVSIAELKYPADFFRIYSLWYYYGAMAVDPTQASMHGQAKKEIVKYEHEKSEDYSNWHAAQTLLKAKKKKEREAVRKAGFSDANVAAHKKAKLRKRWKELRRASLLDTAAILNEAGENQVKRKSGEWEAHEKVEEETPKVQAATRFPRTIEWKGAIVQPGPSECSSSRSIVQHNVSKKIRRLQAAMSLPSIGNPREEVTKNEGRDRGRRRVSVSLYTELTTIRNEECAQEPQEVVLLPGDP
jgi:hypothetical protein